jgi:hypothetical protein
MTQTVLIVVEGETRPLDLDFANKTWTAEREIEEAAFPLIAELNGRRYALYSDGTFNEEEL